jgi:hypothetical protein
LETKSTALTVKSRMNAGFAQELRADPPQPPNLVSRKTRIRPGWRWPGKDAREFAVSGQLESTLCLTRSALADRARLASQR